MIDVKMQQQLKQHFGNLVNPLVLALNLDNSKKSNELKGLAEQLAQLSTKIDIRYIDDSERKKPSLVLIPVKNGSELTSSISFSGVPSGHEFSSLILAILQTGGHPPSIKEDALKRIKGLAIDQPIKFTSYISLSCQTCPAVVQALNALSILHPKISHEMVDGSVFQEEVAAKEIMAVPSVFANDDLFSQGAINLDKIIDKLDANSGVNKAAELSALEPYDVVIIGGGPAGASAAIYSARKGFRTAIVAERFGGQVMDTLSIENFISVTSTDGPHLVANLEQHVLDYDVDIIEQSVTKVIDRNGNTLGYNQLLLGNDATLKSQSVILATGARWRELNVNGETEYRNKGVAYCPHCDGPLFKGKEVAVVGGGNSGIEAAIDLAGITSKVTVLEFSDKLLADEVLQKKAKSMANIEIILNAQTNEVVGDGKKVTAINYIDRVSSEQKSITLDGIFVQIGLVPNTGFIQGDIDLTARGEIIVDERGQTSMSGVFAAGDVTNTPYKQIIIAMGSGATAALGAFDYIIRNPLQNKAAQKQKAA